MNTESNLKKYIFYFQGGHWVEMKSSPELLAEGLGRESEWIYTFDDDGNLKEAVALRHVLSIEAEDVTKKETRFDDLPDEFKKVIEESVEYYKAGRFVDFEASTVAESENVASEQGSNLKGLLDSSPRPEQQALARDIFGSFPKHDLEHKHVHWAKHAPDDGEPEFDPAYTYRDKDGDEWEYLDGRWIIGDTHAKRVAAAREDSPGIDSLLAEFGPYTRIEDPNE